MIITYYGVACFKIQSGEFALAFNPPSKGSKHKSPRFATDIVLISSEDKDYNGRDNLPGKTGGKPFLIDGAGEYEVSGTCIRGVSSNGFNNIVYSFTLEDISVCHLGASRQEIDVALKEDLGEVDVLLIPIGGENLLDPRQAASIATHLKAKIIIPMNYNESQLSQFMKEFGSGGTSKVEKLTIKKKDLVDKNGEVVVLESMV